MQKNNLSRRFLYAYAQIAHARQLLGQHGQFVVMRGKERARPGFGVQILDRGPGQRKPVEGCGAAPHLIQQDQRPPSRGVQDGGRLRHLHHEGRPPAGDIIAGPDARIDAVH